MGKGRSHATIAPLPPVRRQPHLNAGGLQGAQVEELPPEGSGAREARAVWVGRRPGGRRCGDYWRGRISSAAGRRSSRRRLAPQGEAGTAHGRKACRPAARVDRARLRG